MVVFVTVALGRCCAGLVERRTWIGGAGVLFVVAAGLAAYGLNSAFGKHPQKFCFLISLRLCVTRLSLELCGS